MKRAAVLLLLLAAVPGAASSEWPEWAERWLWNAGERTARGLEAFRQGSSEEAVEPLETALRLDAEDPMVLYNAGTGRLATGLGDPTAPLAAAAAKEADLAPSAYYNLGNFRLAQDDYSGAINAYKRALRAAPDFADAKFNLELARRLLEEQQQETPPPQEEPQEEEDSESQQEEQQEEEQEQPPQPQEEEQQEEGQDEFRDLPDMTAEEAAAILEAVENMERERRREEALEAAQKNARGKKDW